VDWTAGCPLGRKLKSFGAEPDDRDVLLQAAKRHVRVSARGDVIREADAVAHMNLLLSGTTCSYKRREDGGRSILSFQHPGDFCDLHRYVLPSLEDAIGIQALTDCTVAVIDYRDMDALLLRPTLASALWRASMFETAAYRERLTSTARSTALRRVAHLLCEQLARREAVGIHALQLPFSQIDVADAAGLSVVHANRTIQALRGLGVLSEARHRVEVIDRKRLEQLAEFDDSYLGVPKLLSTWTVQIEKTPTTERKGDDDAPSLV
jgi:CRP-like cAMP-binding protein